MRLFVALDLPDIVIQNLDSLTRQLKPAAPRLSWSPVSNLHITTKFIGDWPSARLPVLRAALADIPKSATIPVRVEGLGWFPNPHSPRVFWAAVQAPPSLQQLAASTDAATEKLGVAAETRPFHPHLTLARIKAPADLAPLRQSVARLDSVEFGEFEARSFHLYSSTLTPSGSIYEKLAEFPLT